MLEKMSEINAARFNKEVTLFLNAQNHPMRAEIETLRTLSLTASNELAENIKWNGPNYVTANGDRITMKIYPPKQVQLILHRGAAVKEMPAARLIKDTSKLLVWKTNDRALLTFKPGDDTMLVQQLLKNIITKWLAAAG